MGPSYAGDNRLAPDIELKDLSGTTRRLSTFRGKTVILVFWSTTCQVCKQQMPGLAQLAELLKSDDRFAMVTVAVDDDQKAVEASLKASIGTTSAFPVLLDGESKYVLGRYGTRLFPETWVIDSQGAIRARFDGLRDWASATAFDLLVSIHQGGTCPMELQGGLAVGKGASVCKPVEDGR
jgi:peroxiredoxin